MIIDFPSLETINKTASAYNGPIVLFSASDLNAVGEARYSYPCGHRSGIQRIYEPPEILKEHLEKQHLLAFTGGFCNIVLFDPDHRRIDVTGHREIKRCPQCFFTKVLLGIGPSCCICHETLQPGTDAVLIPYDCKRKRKLRLNALRATDKKREYLVACGRHRRIQGAMIDKFHWNGATLIVH